MVSAVIITCNEANELKRCLKSISEFVGEIVIVDLYSNDGSEKVFEEFGAKVFKHQKVEYADPIRNWAIEKAQGEWILMLDPDEELPKSLIDRLKLFLDSKEQAKYVAINIPFKNIFWGHFISHTNFWPDKHLRFFKKNNLKWQNRVHSYPKVEGEVLELDAKVDLAIRHFGYQKRIEFIKKQLKYAIIEARNRKDSGEGFSLYRFIYFPIREFLARFIKHQGYLDGFDGLYLVLCLMIYRMMVEINLVKSK